jgi:hypothetical protein
MILPSKGMPEVSRSCRIRRDKECRIGGRKALWRPSGAIEFRLNFRPKQRDKNKTSREGAPLFRRFPLA